MYSNFFFEIVVGPIHSVSLYFSVKHARYRLSSLRVRTLTSSHGDSDGGIQLHLPTFCLDDSLAIFLMTFSRACVLGLYS